MGEAPPMYTVEEDDEDTLTPSTPSTPNGKGDLFVESKWLRYKGMAFVLLSEMFGACMVATARLLQNGTEARPGMNLFQVGLRTSSIVHGIDMLCRYYSYVLA